MNSQVYKLLICSFTEVYGPWINNLIISMRKLLDADWLRGVQLFD